MRYNITEQTKRELVVFFENDYEYVSFIKSLMTCKDTKVIGFLEDEYRKILDNEKLLEIYTNTQ